MKKNNAVVEDEYRSSRLYYILEAAFEYFVAIMVGTTYLAKLTTSIGISDGVTAVLTSIISLGCGFQIFALFLSGKARRKKFITWMVLLNEVLFMLLYVVPIVDIPKNVKTAIFVCLLVIANIIMNLVRAPKTAWMMSLVDDSVRGSFTAKKEMVSLMSGMVVMLVMGRIVDTFEANGNLRGAFITVGIIICFFITVHAVLLILTKEKEEGTSQDVSVKEQLKFAITDKNILTLLPLFILWNIANYITLPFYGTYQLNDLKISLTFVGILSVMYSIVRTLVSPLFGKIGDKFSFVTMLEIAFGIKIFAFAFNMFAGKAFYTIYYVLTAIAMAGINGGMMNIIYDYTPHTRRMGSLAVCNTVAGLTGFFATLAAKPLLDHIQSNGNRFWIFDSIFAQQVLSFIAAVLLVFVILYLQFVVKKMYKPDELLTTDHEHPM
jgi:MFS family permease